MEGVERSSSLGDIRDPLLNEQESDQRSVPSGRERVRGGGPPTEEDVELAPSSPSLRVHARAKGRESRTDLLWLCDHHVAVHEDAGDPLLDALEDRRTCKRDRVEGELSSVREIELWLTMTECMCLPMVMFSTKCPSMTSVVPFSNEAWSA